MKNTVIISDDSFITPPSVQNAIRNRYAFSIPREEINVKFDKEATTYDVYESDKYICSYDENGNEI